MIAVRIGIGMRYGSRVVMRHRRRVGVRSAAVTVREGVVVREGVAVRAAVTVRDSAVGVLRESVSVRERVVMAAIRVRDEEVVMTGVVGM